MPADAGVERAAWAWFARAREPFGRRLLGFRDYRVDPSCLARTRIGRGAGPKPWFIDYARIGRT